MKSVKKQISVALAIVLVLFSFSACGKGNQDFNKAKSIVIDYTTAVVAAWGHGFDEDCIFEDESVEDGNSSECVSLGDLASLTGLTVGEIETAFKTTLETDTLDLRAVNRFKNNFFVSHQAGQSKVKSYAATVRFNGGSPQIDAEQYMTVCYNVEMVNYLFETLLESELEAIFARNDAETNEQYTALLEVKAYADAMVDNCLNNDQYTYLFKDNWDKVRKETEAILKDKLGVVI